MTNSIHNPDQFMSDLRFVLSQGKKRIGFLIGAGAATAIRIDDTTGKIADRGRPLIPDIAGLTEHVFANVQKSEQDTISIIKGDLKEIHGDNPNIEAILSRIRLLGQAIGNSQLHGLNGSGFISLATNICKIIGDKVGADLPKEDNPYSELVSWIAGTSREHCVEIFTPNYDLLLEEAFERVKYPYFDGFVGGNEPFFDATSIINDTLPTRWAKIWKIHGSLGWESKDNRIVRKGGRNANQMIYPDHLKYDEIQKLPYSALFERLRSFLLTPDSLLITTGFSFFDAHITAVIQESLNANANSAVFAFQYKNLNEEQAAVNLAKKCFNLNVYARDGAVIRGISGAWMLGDNLPSKDWATIRKSYWDFGNTETPQSFILGDFKKMARFFALAQSTRMNHESPEKVGDIAIQPDVIPNTSIPAVTEE